MFGVGTTANGIDPGLLAAIGTNGMCEWVHRWDPAYVSYVHLCSFLQCLLHRYECLWNLLWTAVQRNISRELSSCYTPLYMLLRHIYTKLCLKDSHTGRFVRCIDIIIA